MTHHDASQRSMYIIVYIHRTAWRNTCDTQTPSRQFLNTISTPEVWFDDHTWWDGDEQAHRSQHGTWITTSCDSGRRWWPNSQFLSSVSTTKTGSVVQPSCIPKSQEICQVTSWLPKSAAMPMSEFLEEVGTTWPCFVYMDILHKTRGFRDMLGV